MKSLWIVFFFLVLSGSAFSSQLITLVAHYVGTKPLVVRAAQDLHSSMKGSLNPGDRVLVVPVDEKSEWLRITRGPMTDGFIRADNVTVGEPPEQLVAINGNEIRVRSKPDLSGKVLGNLKNGELIKASGDGAWLEILDGPHAHQYVSAAFVEKLASAPSAPAQGALNVNPDLATDPDSKSPAPAATPGKQIYYPIDMAAAPQIIKPSIPVGQKIAPLDSVTAPAPTDEPAPSAFPEIPARVAQNVNPLVNSVSVANASSGYPASTGSTATTGVTSHSADLESLSGRCTVVGSVKSGASLTLDFGKFVPTPVVTVWISKDGTNEKMVTDDVKYPTVFNGRSVQVTNGSGDTVTLKIVTVY